MQAAKRTLQSLGYAATTDDEIAKEAGMARGLIHYYFKTKEDLLVAALLSSADDHRVEAVTRDPLLAIRRRYAGGKRALRAHRTFYVLLLDAYGVALHNEKVAKVLRELLARDRASAEQAAEALIAALPKKPKASAHDFALMSCSFQIGVVAEQLLDPRVRGGRAIDAMSELVEHMAKSLSS